MNKFLSSAFVGLVLATPISVFAEKATDAPSEPSVTKPDNSKSNKVDESNRVKTAQDQSNSSQDIDLTQKIRQRITADKTLSTYAHNVKIVTVNGHVTLNGVVRTAAEKTAIENQAAEVAGKAMVTNMLKVAPE